ncbi:MAG: Linalool 8-monooxygenase [Pseudonocardia sp.]|jgi:cytochrome P450|uniref:cytochrome P450 n=1 Tax=Pseudonocardia sp. TaxID=60912 RepID=UPI00261426C5|nr:cytochrome P450 [Pseudonocardia sp.]MCU1628487.1 Linalool 8-monooxygenase [Pseudonocardia sp.]
MTGTTAPPIHMQRDEFDPVPEVAALRETEGVRRVDTTFGPAWMVTRFADIREVLGDAARFSTARRLVFRPAGAPELSAEEIAELRAGNLLAFDPPEHTRLRKMLTPEFTLRRMRRLEPRIREIVDEHLDAMERTGPPADLVADFALPVPSLVICELLGVPYSDREGFQARTGRLLDLSLPMDERMEVQRESRDYMAELVARTQADPGEELLGMLVRKHGDQVSTDELIGIAGLLLIAGHETTSNMLGLGTLALLRHPDQLALVRDDAAAVGPAVEELLRWLSIVHSGTTKTTTTEVEIAGQVIPEGETILCALPAGNRDPGLVEDPDRLDVRRGAIGHVAFGHGVHHCLGAPLARMEMQIAFPALLRRFPDLAPASDEARFRSFHVVYGMETLPVTW